MSRKWQRTKAWDDAHLTGALLPVKFVLRLFSSVWLGIGLLVCVFAYCALASIPIGLLALAPTYLLYGVTALVTIGLVAGPAGWLVWRGLRRAGRPARFAGLFLTGLVCAVAGGWLWWKVVWPPLHYDAVTGSGVRLFAEFVNRYKATTLRRLPGMEMTEQQFYAWWPLRAMLLAFVANMIVATLRRIEFNFKHIGVLTVHTGIVLISIGSVYYAGLKKEGDTLLLAGARGADGTPGIGPPQDIFYDNQQVALYVSQGSGFEQRPLAGVPRYNDYNLGAWAGVSAWDAAGRKGPWVDASSAGGLSINVMPSTLGVVDADLKFRIVGYASYAEPVEDWVQVDLAAKTAVRPGESLNPLRIVHLLSELPDAQGRVSDRPAFAFTLLPRIAADRLADNGVLAIEYASPMTDERWRDLTEPLAPGTEHALVVELADSGERRVVPVTAGQAFEVGGWKLQVRELLAQPPFPIITEGYRNASSSVAVIRVTSPTGEAFTRYAYHRYPEIDQEVLDEVNERGMPRRRDPTRAIRIGYIDARQLQVYFEDRAAGGKDYTRAIIRQPGGGLRVIDDVGESGLVKDIVPKVSLRIGVRWDHAARSERPAPVPVAQRDKSMVGTHDRAMLAVEVTSERIAGWRRVVWLPFTKYMGVGMETERAIDTPDGRQVTLAFGRRQHVLPGFELRLVDFQMLAYDHRGSPRDYQSVLRVEPWSLRPGGLAMDAFEHVTRLNAPLTAPYIWSDDRPWLANVVGRIGAGLNPNQFKFSQAGWDSQGWAQSQKQVDAGLIPRPFASFTILGVGNNPGIHIVALGGVLMGVGIPWAFYLKPYLARREKARIQAQIQARLKASPDGVQAPVRELQPTGAETLGAQS